MTGDDLFAVGYHFAGHESVDGLFLLPRELTGVAMALGRQPIRQQTTFLELVSPFVDGVFVDEEDSSYVPSRMAVGKRQYDSSPVSRLLVSGATSQLFKLGTFVRING